MIPTITDIFAGLKDGRYTWEQAEGWLKRHEEMAAQHTFSDEKTQELLELSKPLMKWLATNYSSNPHMKLLIDLVSVEMLDGIQCAYDHDAEESLEETNGN